jgi:hypothetical protein
MSSGGTIILSVTSKENVIFSIYVRVCINVLPLLKICSRDKIMVRMTHASGGSRKELIVTSAFQDKLRHLDWGV